MTNLASGQSAAAAGAVAALTAELSAEERQRALRILNDTRDAVTRETAGLSEAQLHFKPAADRWSIAEGVEHLAVAEDFLQRNIFAQIDGAPAPGDGRDVEQLDRTLLAKLADRTVKYPSPEFGLPTGRWTPAGALGQLYARRARTIEFLNSTPGLRGRAVNHPVLGELDGYQWILAAAGHTARHTAQILEVKADPNFPAQ